jgi:dipeptidase E
MKLLLTSSGISNRSIDDALVDLLGKPIAESSALIVTSGIYPFPGGAQMAWRAICGSAKSPFAELGWKSLGVLELTALTSIQEDSWVPMLRETDVLYVWGGNVLYLRHWIQKSGLADLMPKLNELVYVGCSAGSIVMTPHNCDVESNVPFIPPGSEEMARGSERALGFVDFALWVHIDNENMPDNSLEYAEEWAAGIPVPTYAIDDDTAIKVVDGAVEVVSEGHWELLEPATPQR